MDLGESLQSTLEAVLDFVPRLLGSLLLLGLGYVVARVVAALLGGALRRAEVDRRLEASRARRWLEAALPGTAPAAGLARVAFWLVLTYFVVSAVGALGVPALTRSMDRVLDYLPDVVAAVLIFVVATLLAGALGAAATRLVGDTPTGRVVGTVVPALVMVLALFMILTQLRIAPVIVQIAFAATMGALALALALAFGLGGRSVAERMLEEAYRRGRETPSAAADTADPEPEQGSPPGTG